MALKPEVEPLAALASFVAAQARLRHQQLQRTLKALAEYSEQEMLALNEGMATMDGYLSGHVEALLHLRQQLGATEVDARPVGQQSLGDVLSHLFEVVPTMLAAVEVQARGQAQLAIGAQEDAARIQHLARETQRISEALQLLAINSRIEAAHAGPAGRGFGVVADTLKDVSALVRQTNEAIWSCGSSIQDILGRLSAATGGLLESSRSHAGLGGDLAAGRTAYEAAQREIGTTLERMARHCESLRGFIDQLRMRVQSEDRRQQNLLLIEQRSEAHVAVLERLAEQIQQRPERGDMSMLQDLLEQARSALLAPSPLATADIAVPRLQSPGVLELL